MALFPAAWPAEIISLFVDEVSKDPDELRQSATLSACMLVSKAFYFPSRKYRFTNVELPILLYQNDVKSMVAFLDALKANSTLLQYIRTFTLLFDATDNPTTKWDGSMETYSAPKFATLSEIVEMFSQTTIHTLSIKCKSKYPVNLRRLGEEWHALLVAFRCIPSIEALYLHRAQSPPRTLIIGDPAKDTLKELHLFHVTFSAHTKFHCPRRSNRTHPKFGQWRHVFEAACTTSLPPLSGLQVLKLDNVYSFHSFLQHAERITPLPPPTFYNLRSLSSCGTGEGNMFFGERSELKLLDGVLPSLESLSLLKDPPAKPFGLVREQLDFALFKNLRRLEISGWERDNNCLPALCRLLSCVAAPITVESLFVTITRTVSIFSSLDEYLALPEWSILDGILNNGYFPALQAFSLTIKSPQPVEAGQMISQEVLQETLQEAEREAHISSLLPLLSTNQHISLHLNLVEA